MAAARIRPSFHQSLAKCRTFLVPPRTPRNFGVHFFALRRPTRDQAKVVLRKPIAKRGETMNSRRRLITEPGDRRWLYATLRAAAAGGAMAALLLAEMIVLQPAEPPNDDADRTVRSAASTLWGASTVPAALVEALAPASNSSVLPREASTEASPEPRTDWLGRDRCPR
jgi:hypothetical protein